MKNKSTFFVSFLTALLLIGCASAPPEVRTLHQKEAEIIGSIQESHLALVDAFMDQKVLEFEAFYFSEYGPAYIRNWKANFKSERGKDYDESRDFNLLHADLVAEYLETIAPFDSMRRELREAVSMEYGQALAAHSEVENWLASTEKLDTAKNEALSTILNAAIPGFSLAFVDKKIEEIKKKARATIVEFTR